ncbi:HCP-like protein [Hortaea werneckii]|nr:HCP-like protein [Hortaea werneckii]KAI7477533.1 HCP-like protein [Hortaea werneckii]
MAYDQSSAYEPPRRAYMGHIQQQHQWAPSQPSHGYAAQGYNKQDAYMQQSYGPQYGEDYGAQDPQGQQPTFAQGNNYHQPNASYGEYQRFPRAQQDQFQSPDRGPQYRQPPIHDHPYSRQQTREFAHGPQLRSAPQHQHEMPRERHYDPRYQQRSGRTPPQTNGHPVAQSAWPRPEEQMRHRQEPRQPQQSQDNGGYGVRPTNVMNGGPVQPNGRAGGPPRAAKGAHGTQPLSSAVPPHMRSQTTLQDQVPSSDDSQGSKKMSMEEWKAAEKARMQKMAVTPVLAQDNAFPTFHAKPPNTKDGDRRPGTSGSDRPRDERRSEDRVRGSANSTPRGSEEQSRRREKSRPRPTAERGQDYGNMARQGHDRVVHREMPSIDQVALPHGQVNHPYRPPQPQPQPSASGQSLAERHDNSGRNVGPLPSHVQEDRSYMRSPPPRNQMTPPQPQQRYQTPQAYGVSGPSQPPGSNAQWAQANGYVRQPQRTMSPPAQTPGPLSRPYQQQQRPGTAKGSFNLQPLDTRGSKLESRQPYIAQQPLSPGGIPPRPATAANDSRSQHATPISQYSYSNTPGEEGGEVPMPWDEQQGQWPMQSSNKRETLANLYDAYGASDPMPEGHPSSLPKTREEEIEAEMPDFDSPAPHGASASNKRNTVDRDFAQASDTTSPAPPVPALPSQPSAYQNPKLRPYQQASQTYKNFAAARPSDADRQQNSVVQDTGFDFGLEPGPPEDAQEHCSTNQPSQPHSQKYGQDLRYIQPSAPLIQPPQPPLVHDAARSRSMDDGSDRPIPYRQAPPNARQMPYQVNPSAPGRGPMPPPHRPGAMVSNQPVYSDPGAHQNRGGSAPPMRPGVQSPPNRPPVGGAALTQLNSAPSGQQPHDKPDSLPHHPTPFRAGLAQQGAPQPSKPPPVRQYTASSTSSDPTASTRKPPPPVPDGPVTHAELQQLDREVSANPKNPKRALIYAKKLAEASTVLASDGGRADAKQTAKNRERYVNDALKRIKKLVSQGYPEAQFYLADCYGQGSLGLVVDQREAFNLYQAAAKQGHPQAAYRTAMCCELGGDEGGGTKKDVQKAVQWYQRAARLGDPSAMYKLGIILLKALLGQQRNVGEAVTWLKRAKEAESGNARVLHELAIVHDSANLDPEVRNKIVADDRYALELFQGAASLGLKTAQFRLGQANEYGNLTLPIDQRTSISWYSKAAAQGEHNAELALSGWYLTGADGILQQSDTEAYLWARKAATSEPPLPKAMFAMGYYSEQGIGCPASNEEAKKWYGRAATLERLEELKKNGKAKPAPSNGKLTRNQKKDEDNCVMM